MNVNLIGWYFSLNIHIRSFYGGLNRLAYESYCSQISAMIVTRDPSLLSIAESLCGGKHEVELQGIFFQRALLRIYYRLGTRINCLLHWALIQYQVAQLKLLIDYTLCHVNWVTINPKSSHKIMDKYQVALPLNFRRIFVATLSWGHLSWRYIWKKLTDNPTP